ncbi:MAG: cupin domain-containing protein [Planctomycetaceae bacterium]|nr:cupin domain-containing protein [Planctomycetaceae bacterium]
MSTSVTAPERPASVSADFAIHGYLGPITILTREEAHRLKQRLVKAPAPECWGKGAAATSADYYEIATHPAILNRVASLLGEDVMLCGANLAEREPGQIHHWHSDVHVADPAGRAVTVWLGLENVNRDSALYVLPGSHRLGFCPQQRGQTEDKSAKAITEEDVVRWAREVEADSAILKLDMGDGDALFFDGRMWHGSHNTNAKHWRTALILHYATPDKPIRRHQPDHIWPFRFIDEPKPPCQMLRGTDRYHVNRMVPSPRMSHRSLSRVFDLTPHFEDTIATHWKPDPLFLGSTQCLPHLMLKACIVQPHSRQHAAHCHDYEQVIVPLQGEAILELGDGKLSIDITLKPGMFAYLPPGTMHTVRNDTDQPFLQSDVTWRGASPCPSVPLGMGVYDTLDFPVDAADLQERRRAAAVIIDGPTQTADRLRVHIGEMLPGRVGPMHVDAYDVALYVLEGTIDTLDQRVGPGQMVFYAAGEPHSISNLSDQPSRCLVVELHGTYAGEPYRSVRRWITSRLPRPIRQWARAIRRTVRQSLSRQAR